MTTNHNEFIQDQLPETVRRSYGGYIGTVATAYEQRDQDLANQLYEAAHQQTGASRQRVNAILEAVGLPASREPQPEPQVAPANGDDSDLRQSVEELKGQVRQLIDLATSRLGVTIR